MGPPHRSFWNSRFGVDFRLRDASQEDGPGQWSLSLESNGVQAVVQIWKAWQEHHRGVSNSFPGFSTSTSSLEGDLWFTFPGSEAREGGAEPWLLSSLIFPFIASCTNSRISRGSLLNLSWYSCSSSICSWLEGRRSPLESLRVGGSNVGGNRGILMASFRQHWGGAFPLGLLL